VRGVSLGLCFGFSFYRVGVSGSVSYRLRLLHLARDQHIYPPRIKDLSFCPSVNGWGLGKERPSPVVDRVVSGLLGPLPESS
jgi:hypothetical protein